MSWKPSWIPLSLIPGKSLITIRPRVKCLLRMVNFLLSTKLPSLFLKDLLILPVSEELKFILSVLELKTSGGEFTWYFNVDCPTSPFVKPNIKLTAQLKGSFTTLSGSYSNVGGSVYHTYTSNSEYGVDYTWTVPAKTGYYYVAYTITDYDNATSGSGVTTTALSNRTGHAWNF